MWSYIHPKAYLRKEVEEAVVVETASNVSSMNVEFVQEGGNISTKLFLRIFFDISFQYGKSARWPVKVPAPSNFFSSPMHFLFFAEGSPWIYPPEETDGTFDATGNT